MAAEVRRTARDYQRRFAPIAAALLDVQVAITQALRAEIRDARAALARLNQRRDPRPLRRGRR